jgi:hypothetical protein
MIIQLSKSVHMRRTRGWFLNYKWQLFLLTGDEFGSLSDRLDTDAMQMQLIAMKFPRGDLALFLEAVNNPQVTPHNPRHDKPEPVVSLTPRNTELSLREPPLFSPESAR